MADYTVGVARRPRPLWGINIKRLLDASGEQHAVVAQRAGMSAQQFSNLVNDPDLNPTVDTLHRAAVALGVDVARLFASPAPLEAPDIAHPSIERDSSPGSRSAVLGSETLRATLRGAIADVLTDLLAALGPSGEDVGAHEPAPSHGAPKTETDRVSHRPRRAVR